MSIRLCIILTLAIQSIILSAQTTEYFLNPSFELINDSTYFPIGWSTCNLRSTPDRYSNSRNSQRPTDGESFIGLIMLDSYEIEGPKNEDIVTKLLKPLVKDSVYLLAIDLAYAPEAYSLKNFPQQFRILGIDSNCSANEVLGLSDLITHTDWKKHYYTVSPTIKNSDYLKFEIFGDSLTNSYLLIDNIEINNAHIIGDTHVCKGQQNVSYKLFNSTLISNISWYYSGTDAIITYSADSITIDFGSNASSGNLIANYTFYNTEFKSDTLQITVDSDVPPIASAITGLEVVCPCDCIIGYETHPLNNVSGYIWNYSGTGELFTYNSNFVSLKVDESTTDGILTVSGVNGCGIGNPSSFSIIVDTLPILYGEIFGDDSVCRGDTGLIYLYPPREYEFITTCLYSGIGVNVEAYDDYLKIDFLENASDIILWVNASNMCGYTRNPAYTIKVGDIPANSSVIIGDTTVCLGQEKVPYISPPIENAIEYIWDYSSSGIIMSGTGNEINIDFLPDAVNGFLTVRGTSWCGTGLPSAKLPITINSTPSDAGTISGETSVCLNYTNTYSITPIDNALSYYWNYTGSDTPILNQSDSLLLTFPNSVSSGTLTVAGVNYNCIGEPSPPLDIVVNDCGFNIPNSFTPNGDGINDLFIIRGLSDYPEIVVFNRLGKIVYQSGSYRNNWNGIDIEGETLPSDTYWYVIKIKDIREEVKGFVYLKR